MTAALLRSELAGVNLYTLEIGLTRIQAEASERGIDFATLPERQIAIALLDRLGYPESISEMGIFLSAGPALPATALNPEEISAEAAPHYIRWLPAFLEDPDANTSKNARIFLRWLAQYRSAAIHSDQPSLDNLRRLAGDEATSWRSSAYIVYGLGCCGTMDDYDRVILHAQKVIEHDPERLDLVAEGLYRLHPPALISALQFYLQNADLSAKDARPTPRDRGKDREREGEKEFVTAITLLAKMAEIEDKTFWKTYSDEMDAILNRVNALVQNAKNRAVERVIDQIEKNMGLAALEDE